MNTYPGYVAYWEDVAQRLSLLGHEAGRENLFFVTDPDEAQTLVVAIRQQLTLPCLLVEYYDEDQTEAQTMFSELKAAFVVLHQAPKRAKGHDVVREAIYEHAKPAADAILARMLEQSDLGTLKLDNKRAKLIPPFNGNWVGPLHNDLYGWRYEFTWRVSAGLCYDENLWVNG